MAAQETLRIGYQKSSTLITVLKSQGTLERELSKQGIDVSWHEFPSGWPLLEALNIGNVDLGANDADTVPVFAQAAGARLTYFTQEAPSPSPAAQPRHPSGGHHPLALSGKRRGLLGQPRHPALRSG